MCVCVCVFLCTILADVIEWHRAPSGDSHRRRSFRHWSKASSITGSVTMITESSTNTCARQLTNQTLNLILTLILILTLSTKQHAIVNIQTKYSHMFYVSGEIDTRPCCCTVCTLTQQRVATLRIKFRSIAASTNWRKWHARPRWHGMAGTIAALAKW